MEIISIAKDGEKYDETIQQVTPGYDLIYIALIEVMKSHFRPDIKGYIFDVGAGTGAESIRIMKEFDNLETIAIDYSGEMQKSFESNIDQSMRSKCQYFIQDILNIPTDAEIMNYCYKKNNSSGVKVALSSYTIHHFCIDDKKKTYEMMYDFLEPGGLLINIDLFTYKSNPVKNSAHKFDIDYINGAKIDTEEKDKWVKHYESDENVLDTVELQIEMLRKIGFRDVECVFRYWQQGIIIARKPYENNANDNDFRMNKMVDILDHREVLVGIKDKLINNDKTRLQDTDFIKKSVIPYLQNKKAISCVAISILSKADNKVDLLYSENVRKVLKKGDFNGIFKSYDKSIFGDEYVDFIDFLYFLGRDMEYPEFVNKIHYADEISGGKQQKFEDTISFRLRNEYDVLHVPAGEILFFSFLWRVIIGLVGKAEDLNKQITEKMLDTKCLHTWNSWTEDDIKKCEKHIEMTLSNEIKKLRNSNNDQTSINIINAFDSFVEYLDENVASSVFKELGLNDKTNLKSFVDYVYSEKNDPKNNILSKESAELLNSGKYSNSLFLNILDDFIQYTNLGKKEDITIGKLLIAIHKCARFPLLPYYFLMSKDKNKSLKEQLVFPIWDIFSKNLMYRNKTSTILYCLLTIEPLDQLKDNPYSAGYYSQNKYHIYREFVNELSTIFISFCQPIVDVEYYAKEYKKQEINAMLQRDAISNSYRIGHLFTNQLTNFKSIFFEELQNISRATEKNESIYRLNVLKKNIDEKIDNLASIFIISDMVSKAHTPSYGGQTHKVFAIDRENKPAFTSNTNINLKKIIENKFNEHMKSDGNLESLKNYQIKKFVKDYYGNLAAPAYHLYEILFEEIIINFKSHAANKTLCVQFNDDLRKSIFFDHEYSSALILENETTSDKITPITAINSSNDMHSNGAISYLSTAFDVLKIGKFYYEVVEKSGKFYYQTILFLQGLTNE